MQKNEAESNRIKKCAMCFVHCDAQKPEIKANSSNEKKITIKKAVPNLSVQGRHIGMWICVSL